MDGDFAIIDVVDGDDLQQVTRAVGADVEHTIDLVDVRFNTGPAATALSIACWMSGSAIPWRRALSLISIT
jgi:hypothetical protein